jgi:hypothetical protein
LIDRQGLEHHFQTLRSRQFVTRLTGATVPCLTPSGAEINTSHHQCYCLRRLMMVVLSVNVAIVPYHMVRPQDRTLFMDSRR